MVSLLRVVGEYFLGTESLARGRNLDSFYREFDENYLRLNEERRELTRNRIKYGTFGKIIPNTILSIALANLVINQNLESLSLLGLSEMLRYASQSHHKKDIEYHLTVRRDAIKDLEKEEDLDRISEEDSEGEEWKRER